MFVCLFQVSPKTEKMVVEHKDIVPTFTQNNAWWWAVMIVLCTIAFFANLIFIITVIYNR